MRLLLIEPPEQNPPRPILYPKVLPRGLLITSASLKRAGHEARVLDLRCLNQPPSAIKTICGDYSPDVIGISVHGVPSLPPANACISVCKQLWPSAELVVGGFLVKAAASFVRKYLPKHISLFDRDSDIDKLSLGQLSDFACLDRIALRQPTDGITYSVPRIDYHVLLFPFSSHPLGPYLERDFEPHIETQRGCPYQCRYCGTFPRSPARMLYRDPEEAVEEVKELQARLERLESKKRLFWIADETFTSNREHARRFCEELLRQVPGIRWRAQTRVDLVDPEILLLMKKSGCREISFGIESLSEEVLNKVSKGVDAHNGIAAMSMARRAGLSVRAILIIGLPGDSYAAIRRTFQLLREFCPDACQIYIYHPVPGSPEFNSSNVGRSTEESNPGSAPPLLGFLESPEMGVGDLSREEIVRLFLSASHVFPTRFNPRGDRRQLDRLVDGWRSISHPSWPDSAFLSYAERLALLELAVGSSGDFVYDEGIARACRVSGLRENDVKGLADLDMKFRVGIPTGGARNPNKNTNPKLRQDIVLTRTNTGGLLCDAALNGRTPEDDLLRRTFILRRDMYETLLRCNSHYSIGEIVHAVRAVLVSATISKGAILSNLEQARTRGFLE